MTKVDKDVEDQTEGGWRSRSLLSFGVRALAIGGPVVLATLAARLVLMFLPKHHGWAGDGLALLVAVIVSLLLGKFASRLLPLAVLLKMTMIFPDRAPNRAKVARRATSKDELARRLAHPDPDARETAATLLALVTALGRHDRKTRGHSERVRLYCDLVGEQLGLSAADRGRLRWVGLIHDIGKLEVAAEILNKPGKLSDTEWDSVRTHPHKGAQLAAPLSGWLGSWFDGIEHHHERFDGSGYPSGHAGDEISLAGRAVSVVDAFETMTAARSYKSPMSTAVARAELTRCAGSHFDPVIVRAFLAISLPKLLWAMGPLTFLVNFPFLRWIPTGSSRMVDVAAAGANSTVTAVGATAVTVAVVTSPVAAAHTHAHHDHVHVRLAATNQADHALPAAASGGPVAATQAGTPGQGAVPTQPSVPTATATAVATSSRNPSARPSATSAGATPAVEPAQAGGGASSSTAEPTSIADPTSTGAPVPTGTGTEPAEPGQPPESSTGSTPSGPPPAVPSSPIAAPPSAPSPPAPAPPGSTGKGKPAPAPGKGKPAPAPGKGKPAPAPGKGKGKGKPAPAPGKGKPAPGPGKGTPPPPPGKDDPAPGPGKGNGKPKH